jgi:uncharacterized protein YacL
MVVHITRFIAVTAGAMGGFAVSRLIDWTDTIGYPEYFVIFIFIILGSAIGYLFGGVLGRELARLFLLAEERLALLAPVDFALGTVGVVAGGLLGFFVSQPLSLVSPTWLAVASSVLVYVMCALLGWRIALIKRDDVARAYPALSGTSQGSAVPSGPVKLLDTSAVIDGRFAELRHLGALEGEMRVPRFVLAELQTLADSADDIKRARGRRGLDLLARWQSDGDDIEVFETDYPAIPDVDGKLMQLASDTEGTILTVDHNLTRVADVRGISVINLNELAAALKPAFLPGEALRVDLIKDGKEPEQGVGYLEDGTMVVVQEGRDHVGSVVDTEVTSVLQTSAGRMIFARFVSPVAGTGDVG